MGLGDDKSVMIYCGMRFFLIILFCTAAGVRSLAQTEVVDYSESHEMLPGSPVSYTPGIYLCTHFGLGSLVTTEGRKFFNVRMNYDIVRDELVVIRPNGQYATVSKNHIRSFYIYNGEKNQPGTFLNINDDGVNGYYEVLTGCDRWMLYRKHRREVRSAGPAFGYGHQKSALVDNPGFAVASEDMVFHLNNNLKDDEAAISMLGENVLKQLLRNRDDEVALRKIIAEICTIAEKSSSTEK